jgi:hypothetical protein
MRPISLAEFRRAAPESQEQAAFVQWFRLTYPKTLIYAIPNGAHMSITQAVKLKREGLVAGMPDLHIPQWSLFVEMKRAKGGRLSDGQSGIIRHLRDIGHTVIVAKGWEDAATQIREFME